MLGYLVWVSCVLTATVRAECGLGYTGPWCDTKCSDGCLGGACRLHDHGGIVCSKGCKDGWAGESCRTPCAEHCQRCNRTQSQDCEQCQHSYFGETCSQKCQTCGPAGCSKDGMCIDRPINCDGGVVCDGKNCIKKCRFCNSDGTCSLCQSTYGGYNCEIPCTNCRGKHACTQDGCTHGCRCGYYGSFCRRRCSSTCLDACDNNGTLATDMCFRYNGSCVNGCKDGHFGERCQHRCNTNCKACNQTTGHCTGGCKDGHYGKFCEDDCRNCKHDKCKNDGKCFQCQDGHYGANCNSICDPICTSCARYNGLCQPQNLTRDGPEMKSAATKSAETSGLPSFVIWLCVALAFLTVISLATIGICCHRAKNRRRKKNTALLTYRISHRIDPVPEVPSPVRTNVSSYDYDEIPELSGEMSGRSNVYVDEGQKVGVTHYAVDTDNVGGVWMRDDVRKGKDVKYLSVTDIATTEGYIDVIG